MSGENLFFGDRRLLAGTVISTEPGVDLEALFERRYEDAVVYGDAAGETVLHEGGVRLLANGWLELPTGRLLSPEAVHHVDVQPPA